MVLRSNYPYEFLVLHHGHWISVRSFRNKRPSRVRGYSWNTGPILKERSVADFCRNLSSSFCHIDLFSPLTKRRRWSLFILLVSFFFFLSFFLSFYLSFFHSFFLFSFFHSFFLSFFLSFFHSFILSFFQHYFKSLPYTGIRKETSSFCWGRTTCVSAFSRIPEHDTCRVSKGMTSFMLEVLPENHTVS